jgi:hypothetical protein
LIQLNGSRLGFTLTVSVTWDREVFFPISIQLRLTRFYPRCLFELTREVFLPDQSARIVRAARKVGKSYLKKTLWKFVRACAKNRPLKAREN